MTFPGAPKLVKGGIVLLDPDTGARRRVINLQYNPDSLQRTLQPQGAGADSGDHMETLRLKGPPIETIKLEAELDAVDMLEKPNDPANADYFSDGLAGDLAALETIVYPSSAGLQTNRVIALTGTLEILPLQAPLTIFVWSKNRIVPVRITEFSINEEAFDTSLNPIRAKVSLGMRVLSVNDLTFESLGASLFLTYQKNKEALASKRVGNLKQLGVKGIP